MVGTLWVIRIILTRFVQTHLSAWFPVFDDKGCSLPDPGEERKTSSQSKIYAFIEIGGREPFLCLLSIHCLQLKIILRSK
jgi:hypothetical protein